MAGKSAFAFSIARIQHSGGTPEAGVLVLIPAGATGVKTLSVGLLQLLPATMQKTGSSNRDKDVFSHVDL